MSRRTRGVQSEPVLEQLVAWHRADRPDRARRERLLNRLRQSGPSKQAAPADWRRVAQEHGVPGIDPAPAQRGKRAPVTLAVAAALGLTFMAWMMRPREDQHMANAANSSAVAPSELTPPGSSAARPELTPPSSPCVSATGAQGLLWDASQSTPDLPKLEGRSGRWLHQWATATGNQSAAAPIVPLSDTGNGSGFALRAAGTDAVGWGAKLVAGLSVQVGEQLEEVRFHCYDASAYAGVRFRARGEGILLVLLQTRDSVPEELGGRCREKCWFTASRALALTSDFREHRLEWDQFNPPESSQTPQSNLMLLEFLVQQTPEPYEIVVNEVALIARAEQPPSGE